MEMYKRPLGISLYISLLIAIPFTKTNAFHTASLKWNLPPLSIKKETLSDSQIGNELLESKLSIKRCSTCLSFRRSSSPMDDKISSVDVKMEIQQQRRRQKRQQPKNSKRKRKRGGMVQSTLPSPPSSTAIVPASAAVPNRWRQFRRRRLPRFLLRGRASPNGLPDLDDSFIIVEKNASISGLGSVQDENEPDQLSLQPTQDDTVEVTDQSRSFDEPQSDMEDELEDNLKIMKRDTSPSKLSMTGQIVEGNKGERKKLSKGKRIQFSATETSTRKLLLDEETCDLFLKYMNQPVEDYSLFSVSEQSKDQPLSSRRFNVRRLSRAESAFFEYIDAEDKNFRENYFRLSAPLMPLVGLDLTPVIDLEVIPPETSNQDLNPSKNNWRNRVSSAVSGELNGSKDTIKIRSMRVDLLSTEAEILNAMKGDVKSPDIWNGKEIKSKPATSVSSNKNVQEFGNEAIGFFERMDKNLHPHLDFDSSMKWSIMDSKQKSNEKENHYKQVKVTIKSSIEMSLTIPPAVPFAIPSTMIIKQVGSLIAKRVLGLTLPRFLSQLERDFRRWANAPAER